MSTPTGRAPASRTPPTCRPCRSRARRRRGRRGRRGRRARDSGMSQIPHVTSVCAHLRAACSSVYSALVFVQSSRLRAASSDQPIGEPEADLALGRLGRVGAVDEVVRHRERELAAERAGVGVGRVRRADRLARGRDRALALEHERERRPRGDEVDELAEERLLAVLGVVRLAELARGDDAGGPRAAACRGARSARRSRRRGCARRRPASRG